jgi:hypothetical protein
MIISFISLLVFTFSSIQHNDVIAWNAARKLRWDDFKGTPDTQSPNAALTSSSITIDFGYDETGFEYSIKCNFDKKRSWVKIRNDEILLHEQGHFDIAELYARKLNKVMKDYHYNVKTASEDVNKIYENMMKEHQETQNTYDLETNYSRDRVKQEEWHKKIAADLKGLQAFAAYGKKP